MNAKHAAALKGFDALPDSAGVQAPVVGALFSTTVCTVWRWSKDRVLPAPFKVGGTTLWRVGELRKLLRQRTGA